MVGTSLISIALFGPLALTASVSGPAGTARDVLTAAYGAQVTVEGLLESVRPIGGSSAIATLSDCSGARATVYFPERPASLPGWSLVRLRGTVKEFAGQRELAVSSAEQASAREVPSLAATELARNATSYLCRPVAVVAQVEAWQRSPHEANAIEFSVPAAPIDLKVLLHFERRVLPRVDPEASLTFVGVPSFEGPAEDLVFHVRV